MKISFGFLFCLIGLFSTEATKAYALPSLARNKNAIPHTLTADHDFSGTVALDDCSGSIVRFENSKDSDTALVLTNGHCLETGMPAAGQVIINQPSDREFTVLDASGHSLGTLNAAIVLYSTMTNTDITLYKLNKTYADILAQFHIPALTLSSSHPKLNDAIEVLSGFWQRGYSCGIEAFVPQLKEGDWVWQDSARYSRPGCEVIGGTSGSPVVLAGTRTVVAINNTINESGEACTEDNPCEVDQSGNISYHEGYGYAQETYWLYSCLDATNNLDFQKHGCLLPSQHAKSQ